MKNTLLTVALTAAGGYIVYKLISDVKEDKANKEKAENYQQSLKPEVKAKLMEELNRATTISEELGKLKPAQVSYVKRQIDTGSMSEPRIKELIETYKSFNRDILKQRGNVINSLAIIPEGGTRKEALNFVNKELKKVQNAIEDGRSFDYDKKPIGIYVQDYLDKLEEVVTPPVAEVELINSPDDENVNGFFPTTSGYRNHRIRRINVPRYYLR